MISDKEKTDFKTILGHRYTNKIIAFLNEKGLTNSNGAPYSSAHIRNVFNGNASHDVIEKAIFELVKLKNQELEARKSILVKS